MDTYVFVYGTLRRGEINDLAVAAARAGLPAPEYVGAASVPGRLYDFGDWPGLLPEADGAPVTGDVYRIDPALLPVMDAIEEYDPVGDLVGDPVGNPVGNPVGDPTADPARSAMGDPGRGSCFVRRPVRLTVAGRQLDCYYYPIDPAHIGDAARTDATDWVAHRKRRAGA